MARARTQNTTEEPEDEVSSPAPIAVRPRAQGASKRRAAGAGAGGGRAERAGREERPGATKGATDSAAPLLQVVWIAGIAVSLVVAVALATSTPGATPPASEAQNACGPLGERVADWLHEGFGLAAWTTPLVGVACGLRLAGRAGASWSSRVLAGVAGVTFTGALDHALRGHVALGYPPGSRARCGFR